MIAVFADPNEDTPRPERTIDGCLLNATLSKEVEFPQKPVISCGILFCKARSDHVGELPCWRLLNKKNMELKNG